MGQEHVGLKNYWTWNFGGSELIRASHKRILEVYCVGVGGRDMLQLLLISGMAFSVSSQMEWS